MERLKGKRSRTRSKVGWENQKDLLAEGRDREETVLLLVFVYLLLFLETAHTSACNTQSDVTRTKTCTRASIVQLRQ